MTTTFDEHLDVVQNALKHEWAKDHIRELRKLHHAAEANDELVSERELRLAAQQREQDAKVALAIVERMLASERAAHTDTTEALAHEADLHAATRRAHDQLAAALAQLQENHRRLTAKTTRLEQHIQAAAHSHGGQSLIRATARITELEAALTTGGSRGAENPV